jgi:hypothetical protein
MQTVCKTDDLTAICEPIVLENVEAPTSHNPMGFHGLLQGQLYFFLLLLKKWTNYFKNT